MKGKSHTTEQKIRILRAADGGKRITSTQRPTLHLSQVFGTRSPNGITNLILIFIWKAT